MFVAPKLKIKKLDERATVPSYHSKGDAGMDLYSLDDVLLAPDERKAIKTGIALELPEGHAALVWDRSGLALKEGVVTHGGVVDEGYRGEIMVIAHNLTKNYYQVKAGDRIAQMLIQKVERPRIEVAGSLADSERGEKGFGSSGK